MCYSGAPSDALKKKGSQMRCVQESFKFLFLVRIFICQTEKNFLD